MQVLSLVIIVRDKTLTRQSKDAGMIPAFISSEKYHKSFFYLAFMTDIFKHLLSFI